MWVVIGSQRHAPSLFLVKCTMVSVPVLIKAMVLNPFGDVLEPMELLRSKVASSSMGDREFYSQL